ncbi:MAG: hypothetical protein ABJM06_11870 [Gilvibacter sp.]
MRSSFFLLIFFFCGITLAQKRVLKQWDASALESLHFIADVASSVHILATDTEQLTVSATMEGEYANSLFAGVIRESNGQWTLVTSFESFSVSPNDKLAAHKVKAIELIIEIPKDKEVSIEANDASLLAEGSFKGLKASLVNGNCQLLSYKGNANLEVHNGDTVVFATQGVAGDAISAQGNTTNELPTTGVYLIKVRAQKGDISLFKIE